MPRPWQTVDQVMTDEGAMTLMQRGESDFIIRMEGYILMSSQYHHSEAALGRSVCQAIEGRQSPKVLIGGLGMGYTLRAALDALPESASVTVAELNPVVVDWCSGPLAELTDFAVKDPRVEVRVTDVAALITRAAGGSPSYDAIALDLYEGTTEANTDPGHPFFGRAALERTEKALSACGVLAVWTESADPRFVRRLQTVGFTVTSLRPGKGVPRHTVYVARKGESGKRRPSRPGLKRRS